MYVLTMNLRSQPNVDRLWEGHDDYLNKVDKNTKDKPNVLFIMMDDLGWGDISLNGAIYDTPNIDSIGEDGVNFDNFYSSYSVCSPARFSLMTGRYPFPALDVKVWMALADEFKGKLRMVMSDNPTIRFRMEKGKRGLEELKALFLRYGEIAAHGAENTNK